MQAWLKVNAGMAWFEWEEDTIIVLVPMKALKVLDIGSSNDITSMLLFIELTMLFSLFPPMQRFHYSIASCTFARYHAGISARIVISGRVLVAIQ